MKSQNNDKDRKQLIAWLNDAYSMERSLVKVLENHAKDAADFPDIRARDEQHIAETKLHAERVEKCLELIGEKPSALKAGLGGLLGTMHGMATGPFRDEMVKNFLADYASEHFEIASYKSLIAAAEALDLPEVASLCEENLADEEAMAEWLSERIGEVTQLSLRELASTD